MNTRQKLQDVLLLHYIFKTTTFSDNGTKLFGGYLNLHFSKFQFEFREKKFPKTIKFYIWSVFEFIVWRFFKRVLIAWVKITMHNLNCSWEKSRYEKSGAVFHLDVEFLAGLNRAAVLFYFLPRLHRTINYQHGLDESILFYGCCVCKFISITIQCRYFITMEARKPQSFIKKQSFHIKMLSKYFLWLQSFNTKVVLVNFQALPRAVKFLDALANSCLYDAQLFL